MKRYRITTHSYAFDVGIPETIEAESHKDALTKWARSVYGIRVAFVTRISGKEHKTGQFVIVDKCDNFIGVNYTVERIK